MAARLVQEFVNGGLNSDEILNFLRENDSSAIRKELITEPVSSTAFIYEFIRYLRQQSSNVLEHAPRSANVTAPQKPTNDRQSLSAVSTQREAKTFTFHKEDFPPCTPIKGNRKHGNVSKFDPRESNVYRTPFLQSTPRFSSNGNLEVAPVMRFSSNGSLEVSSSPFASEKLFQRNVPPSDESKKKRATLLLPPQASHQPVVSPTKRITPTPLKPWEQISQQNFTSAEMSYSPHEATNQQLKVVRTMKQELASKEKDEYVSPKMEFVSFKEQIERLAMLYGRCLVLNLVPNLAEELAFVMQLLVAKLKIINSRNNLILGNVNNCAYFSVLVLQHCSELLIILEPSALTLLKNIPHIEEMSLELHVKLCDLVNQNRSFAIFRNSFIQSVSFDADMDNVDNFPNPKSFSQFRHQRDEFYKLFNDCQKFTFGSHNEGIIVKRIHSIFERSLDPCNMLHLAKLLINQMIIACCDMSDNDASICEKPEEPKEKNPFKYSKPDVPDRPVTQHQFTGKQAFFHTFIVNANYAQFHQHLKNVLVECIIEEDCYDIMPDNAETSIDTQVHEELYTLLHRLKLYGAFLGLVEFLPYRQTPEPRLQVVEAQRTTRQFSPPCIDLQIVLERAIREKRLLISLSWIAPFLSMADVAVPKLYRYQDALQLLASVFRSCNSSRPHAILLRTMIGWIFRGLSMPVLFSGSTVEIKLEPHIEAFIDTQLMYMLCPYLSNIRSTIADYYGMPLTEIPKISFVAVNETPPDELGILSRLEEAFFFIHAPSVKKTITFVADRLPSNVAKTQKATLMAEFRREIRTALAELKESVAELTPNLTEVFAQNMCSRLQLKAENHIVPNCDNRMTHLLDELLEADCNAEGIAVAKKICAKQCHLRVLQWIRCNISADYVLREIKECNKDAEKKVDETATCEKRSNDLHYSSPSVVNVLDALENLLRTSLESSMPEYESTLDQVWLAMKHRKEWKPTSWTVVLGNLVDFGVVSIIRNVDLKAAEKVLKILFDVNCESHFQVDNKRNCKLIEMYCTKDYSTAKQLLGRYQLALDKLAKC